MTPFFRPLLLRLSALLAAFAGASGAALAQVPLFVHLTDLHVGKPASYETPEKKADALRNLQRITNEVNTLIKPDFVLITGDLVSVTDEPSTRLVAQTLKGFHAPVYAVPGNHDDGIVEAGWFQKYLGPTRRVIDQPPWYVVAFDGRPFMKPRGAEPAELLAWIEAQMARPVRQGQARLVVSHYPLHIDARWSDKRFPRPFFQMTGAWPIRLNLLLEQCGAAGYLAGHTHGAYRVVCWDKGVLSSASASVGKWPRVVVLQPAARYGGGDGFVDKRVTVRAHVLSPYVVERVELICDGAPALMEKTGGVWQTVLDTTSLENGGHALTVRAHAGGRSGESVISVAVSNNRDQ